MTMRAEVVDAGVTTELRRSVLRPNQEPGTPLTSDEPDAVHVAVLDGADPVGACVLLPRPYPSRPHAPHAWQLRSMATAPQRRGAGIGALVVAGAVEEVVRRGGQLLWCNARITAQRFYERNGFVAEGPEFRDLEMNLPHVRMWRELPADPISSLSVGGPADA